MDKVPERIEFCVAAIHGPKQGGVVVDWGTN